jgi:hypothetical protein
VSYYAFNRDSVPPIMRERRQWVNWTLVNDSKVPKRPDNPRKNASIAAPYTWATFEQAAMTANENRGVGFVFTANDPLVFVDLDWQPEPSELQTRIVGRLETYTELSPSGRGAHCFLTADKAVFRHAVKLDGLGVELYAQRRYSTVTGRTDPFRNRPVAERTDALLDVMSWLEQHKVKVGQRNTRLMREAGCLRYKAATRDEIAAGLHLFNEQLCDPPLPDTEVQQIADGVQRYELTGFTAYPRCIQETAAYRDLSSTQKAVLHELVFRAAGRKHFTAPVEFWQERGWTSPKTYIRAIRALEAAGFVRTVFHGFSHKPSIYTLEWQNHPLLTFYKDFPFEPQFRAEREAKS